MKGDIQHTNESYQQLLTLTESLLLLAEEDDWDKFLAIELKRKALIQALEIDQNGKKEIKSAKEEKDHRLLIENIHRLNSQLLTTVSNYQSMTKNELIKFQKSKKANDFYNS